MANVRAAINQWLTVHADSRRWDRIEPRDDDIVISTPPKSGTTWMQGVVHSLLWPEGGAPVSVVEASPWIDVRIDPVEDVAREVAAQRHRRFLKTHTPADCLPLSDTTKYLVVYRDGRDALVSWGDHRTKMHPAVIEALNASAAADGLAPVSPVFDGNMDVLFEEWTVECSPVRHLASWWPLRHDANVCFVHYADLLADLDGEMRRVAAFLDIELPADLWAPTVARCRIDEMRAAADATGLIELVFAGGAASLFNQGTNGRWVGTLTEQQVDQYLALVADGLPKAAARWLAEGSLALGVRPGDL